MPHSKPFPKQIKNYRRTSKNRKKKSFLLLVSTPMIGGTDWFFQLRSIISLCLQLHLVYVAQVSSNCFNMEQGGRCHICQCKGLKTRLEQVHNFVFWGSPTPRVWSWRYQSISMLYLQLYLVLSAQVQLFNWYRQGTGRMRSSRAHSTWFMSSNCNCCTLK